MKVNSNKLKKISNLRKDIFNQLLKDRANNKTKIYQYSQRILFINIKGNLIEEEIKALNNRVSSIDLNDSKVLFYSSLSRESISKYYI